VQRGRGHRRPALGTAAFAVILDDWVFSIPAINIGGLHLTLFSDGTVNAVGPSVFGVVAKPLPARTPT
jgi:hypothetical protein